MKLLRTKQPTMRSTHASLGVEGEGAVPLVATTKHFLFRGGV